MMTLLPSSSSEASDPARAYERLHPTVQAWIWQQKWEQLRAIQARAVDPILAGDSDVIISAATAGGKTEAAWLPICSALAFERDAGRGETGVKALYISPLKALINDQYGRLQDICRTVDLPVMRRHGDVTGADRKTLLDRPDGILLITPESLEALFVLQGPRMPQLLNGLRYVVIDELHAFIGTERGAQLQSLLHRVELAVRRTIPRVALSATLADPGIAAEFLRPGTMERAVIISGDATDRAELKLILRGYVRGEPRLESDDDEIVDDPVETRAIAENIFATMRGKDNLVFANSRGAVETYADILTRMSDEWRVPNEFYAHHGNLSKEHREDVERKLKTVETNATAICTSTLEMGIDIGSVDTVGQIGPPSSVSALRQRMGRSGRRGTPAVLRVYVTESELTDRTPPIDQLRWRTVQAIAVIDLLLEKWYEPPNVDSLHLSTLVQQILSVIAQHGGATAAQIFSALCARGPFARVDREMFVQLLRDLGGADVIIQASDGLLLPGGVGERIINHYSFYTAFQTPQEYRLVANGRTLGSLPIVSPVMAGSLLIFAGRRWRVLDVDATAKVIELTRASGGRAPLFSGRGAEIANGIRSRMRNLYLSAETPSYLDATAQQFLADGQTAFRRLGLDRSPLCAAGQNTLIFPWRGDRTMNTLAIVLKRAGIEAQSHDVAIECPDTSPVDLIERFRRLASAMPPVPELLARDVLIKVSEKYDHLLGESLLNAAYAARNLDLPATWALIEELSSEEAVGDGRMSDS